MQLGRFETNHIYNEDSYKAIKDLPDKCIDCIYTDIPYLTSFNGAGMAGEVAKNTKKEIATFKEVISEHKPAFCKLAGRDCEWLGKEKQLAIEELEKVKNWCEHHKYSDDFDYIVNYKYDEEDGSGDVDYLKDYIDDQIKELKGEK